MKCNSNQSVLFHDLANPSSFTYDPGLDTVIVTKTLPGTVNFASTSFPNYVVIFKPNGSVSASGQVALYSAGEDYFGYVAVDVLGSTGRVKLIFGDYFD